MLGEAVVDDNCTQKAECIHKSYNGHNMLGGEHMERSSRKKEKGEGFVNTESWVLYWIVLSSARTGQKVEWD